MTNHVILTHKIRPDDSKYTSLVTECVVIPKCFIKFEFNKPVLLSEDELAAAKRKFEPEIQFQTETLKKLKVIRSEMEITKREIETKKKE